MRELAGMPFEMAKTGADWDETFRSAPFCGVLREKASVLSEDIS